MALALSLHLHASPPGADTDATSADVVFNFSAISVAPLVSFVASSDFDSVLTSLSSSAAFSLAASLSSFFTASGAAAAASLSSTALPASSAFTPLSSFLSSAEAAALSLTAFDLSLASLLQH